MALSAQQLDELRKKSIAAPLSPEDQAKFDAETSALYDPQRAAVAKQTEASKLSAQGEFKDLETRIRERMLGEQKGLVNNLSSRGFLRSGEQVGVGERITSTGLGDINKADIARAVAEADAILRESQANLDITREAKSYSQQLADREFNRRSQEAGLYGQQYETELNNFNTANKLDQVDAGDRILFVNGLGEIVKEVRKGSAPTSGTAGYNTPLSDAVKSFALSGNYTASGEAGKKSREQMIADLTTLYSGNSKISPDEIATAVYSQFRNPNEGGFAGLASTKPISAEQQKVIANVDSGLSSINTIRQQLATDKNILAKAALPGSLGARTWTSAVGNAADVIGRLRSGGAINEDELKTFKSFLPQLGDNQKDINYKLGELEKLFNQIAGRSNPGSTKSGDPLGLR